MKLERDGDSFVSTPIYVGNDAAIAKAARCSHSFEADRGPATPAADGKALLQREQCKLCVGMRMRLRPAAGVTPEEFQEACR